MYAWSSVIANSRSMSDARRGVMMADRERDQTVNIENMYSMMWPEDRLVDRRIMRVRGRMS